MWTWLYEASFKLATDGRDDSARHLYFTKDAACIHESRMDNLKGAPILRAVIGGSLRTVLVYTGSSISLIQPGVCSTEINRATVTPYGMTGEEIRVQGEQVVIITINGETYAHEFYVCELATEADAIIGTDFFRKMDAILDFDRGKLLLKKAEKTDHEPCHGSELQSRRDCFIKGHDSRRSG